MKRQIIKSLKDFLGEIHQSDFSDLSRFKESAAAGWIGFILFCLSVTWLTSFSVSNLPENIRVGQVITRDIRADRNLSVVNEEETSADRKKATESVLPVFDYDEALPAELPERARAPLAGILTRPILSSREPLVAHLDSGVVLRRIHPPENVRSDEEELVVKNISKIWTVDQARQALPKAAPKNFQRWVVPNTTFNLQETESRKEAASRSVKEKIIHYQAGDFIVRAGTKLEPKDVQLLEKIKKTRGLENTPIRFLGTFLFVALALGGTFYFSERFVRRFLPERKDYVLMGTVIVVILAMLRMSLLLAGAIHEAFFFEIPRQALYYAIPVAGGVMLVRMVLTAEVTLVLAVILSLLAGLTVGSNVNYTTYCLISCIAAGCAVARVNHRAAIFKAGLITGVVNALAVLGIHLLQIDRLESVFRWDSLLAHLGFAMLGGILAAVFVLVAAPIVEWLFDYTTDIKLLELGNLNHPLLKELVVRAPGTYHHSHMVGMLAEAAAEAIGANSLLVRVSAYYHDIGKMKTPTYYTENDTAQENRHEALNPHMSALIVASHVKEGMALAKMHKLPRQIIDMIPQHHGTKQIGFFYEKARESNDPKIKNLEEKDFRYPGPKPQTREAGILMLADSVEAAVRSLPEKSPTRIQQTVEMLIDKSFAESQLDECDLTLRDLHEIAKAFTRTLLGIYHQRIPYANQPNQPTSEEKTPTQGTPGAEENRESNIHRIQFPKV